MSITFIRDDAMFKVVENQETIHSNWLPVDAEKVHLENLSKDVIEKIFSCQVKDLPSYCYISGLYTSSFGDEIDWFELDIDDISTTLLISLTIDLSRWAQPFDVYTFKEYLNLTLEDEGYHLHYQDIEDGEFSTHITTQLNDRDTIHEKYQNLTEKIFDIYKKTLNSLNKKHAENYIIKSFRFPNDYQNICSQYLIWFGEFLEKFGINALISINNEGNETQVVVSSEHTEQMFADIEALFSQYIALPYAEYLPASSQALSPEQQFMVTQLQTQVNHFKGQLEMKSAAIQLKEATLQSLQNTIQTQQNTIDVQKNQLLLIESIQGDEEVQLFGGAIKLGEIEWGPLKICPKKLLDKVRKN